MESEKSALSEKINSASFAASVCHPAETGGGGTVTTLAKQGHTGHGTGKKGKGRRLNGVTLANTKRHKRRKVTLKNCEFCGAEYATPRPSQSRFCSGHCRRGAWLQNNPDKAAVIAERDKVRLKAHLAARGVVWIETGEGVQHG